MPIRVVPIDSDTQAEADKEAEPGKEQRRCLVPPAE